MAEVACPDCERTFVSGRALGQHRKLTHTPGYRRRTGGDVAARTCDGCGETFETTARGIASHRRACRPALDSTSCSACGRSFATRRALRIHRAKVHGFKKEQPPRQSLPPAVEPGSLDEEILAARTGPADPLACPWPHCRYVAPDVPTRNRHVLEDCERRPPEKVERARTKYGDIHRPLELVLVSNLRPAEPST